MRFIVSFILMLMCSKCLAKSREVAAQKPINKPGTSWVIPVDTVTPKITSEDVAQIIPLDMQATSDSNEVASRLADRGLNYWLNSPAMKDSTLVRVANEAQEKLKTDVIVQGGGVDKVKHKFSFRVEAFQALAKFEYTGWMKAAVNYDAKAAQTNIQFSEKVFANKDLTLTHKASSKEALSMVGLGWNF
ncbi:hypothetical protein D3C72_1368690 [compost metagenome]